LIRPAWSSTALFSFSLFYLHIFKNKQTEFSGKYDNESGNLIT
jgi:hypothetical protein